MRLEGLGRLEGWPRNLAGGRCCAEFAPPVWVKFILLHLLGYPRLLASVYLCLQTTSVHLNLAHIRLKRSPGDIHRHQSINKGFPFKMPTVRHRSGPGPSLL